MSDFRTPKELIRATPADPGKIRDTIKWIKKYCREEAKRSRNITSEVNGIRERMIKLEAILVQQKKKALQQEEERSTNEKEIALRRQELESEGYIKQKLRDKCFELFQKYQQKLKMVDDDEKYLQKLKNAEKSTKQALTLLKRDQVEFNSQKSIKQASLRALQQQLAEQERKKAHLLEKQSQLHRRLKMKSEVKKKQQIHEKQSAFQKTLENEILSLQAKLQEKLRRLSTLKRQNEHLEQQNMETEQINQEKSTKLEALSDKLSQRQIRSRLMSETLEEVSVLKENFQLRKAQIVKEFGQRHLEMEMAIQHARNLILDI